MQGADCFLRLTVDMFCNHDPRHMFSFYFAHLLCDMAHKARSLPLFRQAILFPIYEGDPELAHSSTPWGEPYTGVPRDMSEEERKKPMKTLLERYYAVLAKGEAELLRQLRSNPSIECDCLTYEDPTHVNFGKRDQRSPYVKATTASKVRPLLLECGNCQKMPAVGTTHPSCQGCKRTYYCSVDCQRAHRKAHKQVCCQKAADWWGHAHVLGRKWADAGC